METQLDCNPPRLHDARRAGRQARPRWSIYLLAAALMPTLSLSAADPRPEPIRPLLRASTPGQADTLTVPVKTPVTFHLQLPTGEDWDQANIGRLVVRTYGRQTTIPTKEIDGKTTAEYTFDEPGIALVILCAGHGKDKGESDAWQRTPYCTKLVLRVTDRDGRLPHPAKVKDPGTIGKSGLAVEVLPYAIPWRLHAGDDLPVRIYFQGNKLKGVQVVAHKPDGSAVAATTDAKGITIFNIDQPGRWIVRYNHDVGGEIHTGSLVFEVLRRSDAEGGASK